MSVYMVTYKDDFNKKHMTFVKSFSAVKFFEERFSEVRFERTENYPRTEKENYEDLFSLINYTL